jgi:Mesyanzhinovviridae DNA helicase
MPYVPPTPSYAHQVEYLRHSLHRRAFANFSDMGTGKSKEQLDECGVLIDEGLLDTVLITSGKGNYMVWVDQIRDHLSRSLDALVCVWDGSDSIRSRDERRAFLAERTRPRFLLANIEALATSPRAGTFVQQVLRTSSRRMVVVDESTLIKNHEARRTQVLAQLGRSAEYRRILSGNPTPNSPVDLWGQFMFLGGDLLGHRSFWSFRARYCVLQDIHIGQGRTRRVVVAPKNLDELAEVVSHHSYRVRKEECLDLPAKVYQYRNVELTTEQRIMYDDMRRFAIAQIQEAEATHTVTARLVIGQLSKMHQILCGVTVDDAGVEREIPNNRLEAMLDVVRESGRQCIVWCAYQANVRSCVRALTEEFGRDAAVAHYGPSTPEERASAIREFQAGNRHVFVATPDTAGRGLTLTAAKTVVYFSNGFNLELREQSEDRAHRIGQTASVNYVDLIVPDTLDQRILVTLRQKMNMASQIMQDGYKTWLLP